MLREPPMKYRRLPRTELDVSPICLGTMTFGTPVDQPAAVQIVRHALDSGINFIDTADIYEGYARYMGSPGGRAEEFLGEALKGRRGQAIVTTKVGNPVGPEAGDTGLSRAHITGQIEASLKRLRNDYVDLYPLHRPDPATRLE
jgi:aryl-alcohol dehydrogenase-like predicted oxidoreductase